MPVHINQHGQQVKAQVFGFADVATLDDIEKETHEFAASPDARDAMDDDSDTKIWMLTYENGASELLTDEEYRSLCGDW